jgi:hypothetical protein
MTPIILYLLSATMLILGGHFDQHLKALHTVVVNTGINLSLLVTIVSCPSFLHRSILIYQHGFYAACRKTQGAFDSVEETATNLRCICEFHAHGLLASRERLLSFLYRKRPRLLAIFANFKRGTELTASHRQNDAYPAWRSHFFLPRHHHSPTPSNVPSPRSSTFSLSS